MEFEGLRHDDLQNVFALNHRWLSLRPSDAPGYPRPSGKQLERLASAPFLLFSFREHDDQTWRSLPGRTRQPDLLAEKPDTAGKLLALQSAGLAFLWELSRRNPYVARLVSGAPLHWCEQIASLTLLGLLDCSAQSLLIEPRFDDASALHKRLWRRGGSALHEMRKFAQIGALQTMLTSKALVPYRRLPAAACRMPQPAQQVADEV